MSEGIIFDIREFCIHDGPGIRTTVFLKGCPLRCKWCHNPEGMSAEPQMINSAGSRRIVGEKYQASEVADRLNSQADILCANEGGVTFSGGEPLMQSRFVKDIIDLLDKKLHIVLDTSGCGTHSDFQMLAARVDMVYFDLKLIDRQAHVKYTGVDNDPILCNLRALSEFEKPFVIRIPLVPTVTDTDENLSAIAKTVRGLPGLVRVDLLPYNKAAGGKYASAGMVFDPGYDESAQLNLNIDCFKKEQVEVRVA
ncbi:MAG: radical SAM protein [Armatimonadota bacterium]